MMEKLYLDGEEAFYFDSPKDLVEKTKFLLKNPRIIEQVAIRGRRRCLQSGYDAYSVMRIWDSEVKNTLKLC